ncbi:type VII secretion protein EccB [Streptomyces sp. MST-110588]|uniref:type VII secretion protein EccB n=1 Tax=Streptomyces sp. MST-110588 TaxID=2833628 RepID=UPI001F5D9227|nr:type VII secretion protein EccB [Streptomyces sp. MST-110588]UNO39655.1 type VII secretion protein EccB [Streptomyces sp. MST-110588]
MASRRDELNAYSFARKRTTAAFLKPLPNGSIESAPRPLRSVLPSIVLGAVVLVGFGACGILKPVAPKGWDTPAQNVIVGDESTTRYVVLNSKDENGKNQKLLHPILNLASAKLLLDPKKFKVVKVKESELDGKIPHGPAIGIPYAPDRLPSAKEAEAPKVWAVCVRPGSGENSKAQQAVFVLGGKDKKRVEGNGRLDLHQALYVQDPKGVKYLVDQNGVAFTFDATMGGKIPLSGGNKEAANALLRRIIFGDAQPQQVSAEWMNTLIKSPVPIGLPAVPDAGKPSTAKGVPAGHNTIGSILQTSDSQQKYVVLKDGLEKVSNFIAKLLLEGPNAQAVQKSDRKMEAISVSASSITPKTDEKEQPVQFMGADPRTGAALPWPSEVVSMANAAAAPGGAGTGLGSQNRADVTCSVYKGTSTEYANGAGKALGFNKAVPDMATWVGKDYPAPIAPGATSYVTPGSGLLYQQVTANADSGSLFLVTDTGLRYSVPRNNDSADKAGNAEKEQDQSKLHLGYENVRPPTVDKAWSQLLSEGPVLDVSSAKKPQSS